MQLKGHRSVGGMRASLVQRDADRGRTGPRGVPGRVRGRKRLSHGRERPGPSPQPHRGRRARSGCPGSSSRSLQMPANPRAARTVGRSARTGDPGQSVLAIGRAGTGVNNIPVAAMSCARHAGFQRAPEPTPTRSRSWCWPACCSPPAGSRRVGVRRLARAGDDPELRGQGRGGQEAFAGYELAGHTLGVVGLGKVGCLVADAAIELGMHVIGYDPEITVESAWRLPSSVQEGGQPRAPCCKHSEFHQPARAADRATRGMIDAGGVSAAEARERCCSTSPAAESWTRRRSWRRCPRGSWAATSATSPARISPGTPGRDPVAAPRCVDRGRRRRTAR